MCPPTRHIGATWRIRLSSCLLLPTRLHNPNGKSFGSAVFTQLMARFPILYNRRPFPQNCPFPWGIWIPICGNLVTIFFNTLFINEEFDTFILSQCSLSLETVSAERHNKSSAVAEMGDRGHNRHGLKRRGLLCLFR